MKKLLLIPALMLGTLANANQYDYEISPMIGYNINENNLDLDNHFEAGAELQFNKIGETIHPEISLFYSKGEYQTSGNEPDMYRIAINGVYEFEKLGNVTPLVKAGIGYRTLDVREDKTTDSLFLDAGVGAKIPFSKQFALKMEAVYTADDNDARVDSNLALLVGINFSFGGEKPTIVAKPVEEVKKPIDDDKDGVVNSIDKCPNTIPNIVVDANGCSVDTDNDGVLNSIDSCPKTIAGTTVDAKGCDINADDDKDGVINSKDICPDSVEGDIVNSDGCIAKMNLDVTFRNNSAIIAEESYKNINDYATFLNTYNGYNTKITGYTDSMGEESYNQQLSEKRANAVKDMLIVNGVDNLRVVAEGKGEANPIADNKTRDGRAKNRRIEAELIKN